MNGLLNFLETSYTAYHATENAARLLDEHGFLRLNENEHWKLDAGGRYYTVRGGSSLIAFTVGKKNAFQIVASHTDSPCLKLKEHCTVNREGFTMLNAEPYGGGIYYTFFDRSLKIAGRVILSRDGGLTAQTFTSEKTVVIPSLAVHMNREVNEKFAPNPQTDLMPLFALGEAELPIPQETVSYDLFVVCAEKPFESGANGELVCSPRIDNLTSVYSSLCALAETEGAAINVCACLNSEEVGSRTREGAGSDFLSTTLRRIAMARGLSEEDFYRAIPSSFLISLDNAHSVHPNHPEKCDPTNRAVMGGGVVIKGHAGGAYTTDAYTSAVVKTIFSRANVKYQTFYNRSDMRSGSTLGAISLGQISVPSADLGLAQLAMHSAVETFSKEDYFELKKGLIAFCKCELSADGSSVTVI